MYIQAAVDDGSAGRSTKSWKEVGWKHTPWSYSTARIWQPERARQRASEGPLKRCTHILSESRSRKKNKKYAGIGGPCCGRDSDMVISRTRLMFASRQIWTSRPSSTDKRLDICPRNGDAAKSPKFGDRWTSTLCILAEVAANVSVELRNRATEKPPRVELRARGSGPGCRRVCGMGVRGACVWLRKLNLQPGL
jgi:hypothetical protein